MVGPGKISLDHFIIKYISLYKDGLVARYRSNPRKLILNQLSFIPTFKLFNNNETK
jgi:hypothetical protein